MLQHQQQHQQHVGGSNKNLLSAMSPLLACRSGRPVDPDAVPLIVEKNLPNGQREKQGLSNLLGSARKQRKSISSSRGHPKQIDTATPVNLIQKNGVVQACSSHKKGQKNQGKKGNDYGDRVRNHWVSRKGSTSPLSWDQYFQSQWSNYNPDNPILNATSHASSVSGTANLSSTSTSTADGNGTHNDTVNDSDWFHQDHEYQRQLMCGRNVARPRLPQETAATCTSTASVLPSNSFKGHPSAQQQQQQQQQQQLHQSTKYSPQHMSSAMTPKTSTPLTTRATSILPAPSLTETISTSLSSGDEVSLLSFHHDDDGYYTLPTSSSKNNTSTSKERNLVTPNPAIKTPIRSRANTSSSSASSSLSSRSSFSQRQSNKKGSQELKFWRTRASHCFDQYGVDHVQTATAFLELGMAHVRCEVRTAP